MTCEQGRLRTGQKVALVRGMIGSQLADSVTAVARALKVRGGGALDLDTVPVPDSALVRQVDSFAAEVLPGPLLVHSRRTYLIASLLAQDESLHVDPELLLVASLLHDIGLAPQYLPQARVEDFTCLGGREAEQLLLAAGWAPDRAAVVFDAISLHVNPRVDPEVHGPEAHVLAAATAMETVGSHRRRIPVATMRQVLTRHPRDGFTETFLAALTAPHAPGSRADTMAGIGAARLVRRNPLDSPPYTNG
jgi:hypothetical protein